MFPNIITLDKIRSEEEFKQLVELAKQDNHGVFFPSHALRKNNELVGYFSIGHPGATEVWAWLSTKGIGARESIHLANTVESIVASSGSAMICAPMPKTSPFYPLMNNPKSGYVNAGEYTFFIKRL